jgi:hypothetical protein
MVPKVAFGINTIKAEVIVQTACPGRSIRYSNRSAGRFL